MNKEKGISVKSKTIKEFDEPKKTVETELRIDEVCSDILSGRRRLQVCAKYSEAWNVNFRTIDWYLAEARKRIIESQPDSNINERIKVRLAEYDKLHQLAISENQYGVARAILRDKSELEGMLIERIELKALVITKQTITLPDGSTLSI